MKSKILVACAFATGILATTIGSASSTERHAHMRVHYLHHHHHVAHLAIRHHYAHRIERRHRALARRVRHEWAAERGAARGGSNSGIASVYSGGRTANGEYARAGALTAAHRSLPFGTMVRVTNNRTGRSVVVRINDRGPFVRGRVIDLTPAGARALGFSGLAPVTLSVVGRG
jgi:rare lipoprotein A